MQQQKLKKRKTRAIKLLRSKEQQHKTGREEERSMERMFLLSSTDTNRHVRHLQGLVAAATGRADVYEARATRLDKQLGVATWCIAQRMKAAAQQNATKQQCTVNELHQRNQALEDELRWHPIDSVETLTRMSTMLTAVRGLEEELSDLKEELSDSKEELNTERQQRGRIEEDLKQNCEELEALQLSYEWLTKLNNENKNLLWKVPSNTRVAEKEEVVVEAAKDDTAQNCLNNLLSECQIVEELTAGEPGQSTWNEPDHSHQDPEPLQRRRHAYQWRIMKIRSTGRSSTIRCSDR